MPLRPSVVATSFALLLCALAPVASVSAVDSPPAVRAAKPPKVTIKDVAASSEVGRKVKITGTAKPGRSGRATVAIQRRYGSGAWTTVATDRANKRGRYAVRVPLTQGGPTSFRVKRAGGGTSKVESLAVYEWLYLADQPFLLGMGGGATRVTSVVGGRSLPLSIELWTNNLEVLWSVAACTSVDFWTGFTDRGRAELDPADQVDMRFARIAGNGDSTVVEKSIPIGPAVRQAVPLTAATSYVSVALRADTVAVETSADVVLGTPRARCNAHVLPAVKFADLPFPSSTEVR
ncbi:hypothetical protein [Nocardioides sp. 503]|uniref:hypothetical protein n=1 Tax=Nocardioides sp. 503 TaxID=2508326 RepID=UPI00107068DC|nr:hypothetical protein [Nocardioides sp. 503]